MKRGQTFLEYTMVIAAIAIVAFVAYRAIGNDLKNVGTNSAAVELTNA